MMRSRARRRVAVLSGALLALAGLAAAGSPPRRAGGRASPAEPLAGWLSGGVLYETNLEYYPNRSFADLEAHLPRLQALGVTAIYITPIWEDLSGDTHHYLIRDYERINPRFGDAEGLRSLVAAAHARGIRVLLDLVTSLTTEGSVIWESHRDWILRGDDGSMQRYYPFPDWGWAIDAAHPGAIAYFAAVARHYVADFDVDGWRVDSPQNNYDPERVSGDHTRLRLLQAVRAAIRAVKPDAALVAEVPGPETFWGADDHHDLPLFDEVCEASYGYPFIGFLAGDPGAGYAFLVPDGSPANGRFLPSTLDDVANGRIGSAEFVRRVRARPRMHHRLRANFLENHDTERVAVAFPYRQWALAALIMTLPGLPVIHAGQEIGATTHPFYGDVRVDWDHGDLDLEAYYAALTALRAAHPALRRGAILDAWAGGDPAVAYLRLTSGDAVLVTLNFRPDPAAFTASVPPERLHLAPGDLVTVTDVFTGARRDLTAAGLAALDLTLDPFGVSILLLEPAEPPARAHPAHPR